MLELPPILSSIQAAGGGRIGCKLSVMYPLAFKNSLLPATGQDLDTWPLLGAGEVFTLGSHGAHPKTKNSMIKGKQEESRY